MTINQLKKEYKQDKNMIKFINNFIVIIQEDKNDILDKIQRYYDTKLNLYDKSIEIRDFMTIISKILEEDIFLVEKTISKLISEQILKTIIWKKRKYIYITSNKKIDSKTKKIILEMLIDLERDEVKLFKLWSEMKKAGIKTLLKDNYGIVVEGFIDVVNYKHNIEKELIQKCINNLKYSNKIKIEYLSTNGITIKRKYIKTIKK